MAHEDLVEEIVINGKTGRSLAEEKRNPAPEDEYVEVKPHNPPKEWLKRNLARLDSGAKKIGTATVNAARWAQNKKREIEARKAEVDMRAAEYNARLSEYRARTAEAQRRITENKMFKAITTQPKGGTSFPSLTVGSGSVEKKQGGFPSLSIGGGTEKKSSPSITLGASKSGKSRSPFDLDV